VTDTPYKVLIDSLAGALAKYDGGDRSLGRYTAMMAVIRFLGAINVSAPLIKPLYDIGVAALNETTGARHRGKPGAKPKTDFESFVMVWAAASVTALKERGKCIDDTLRTVGRAGNIEAKRLRNFRDNLNRGLGNPTTLYSYDMVLDLFRSASPDEDLEQTCLKFLRDMSPFC
jgi:hypothetical protein